MPAKCRVLVVFGDIRLEVGEESVELTVEQARELSDLLQEAAEFAENSP